MKTMMKFWLDLFLLHKKKKKKKTTTTTTTTTTEENAAMAAIPISYITASQLTKLLPSPKLAIIDVRDEERSYDGHIAGSWHFASDTFNEKLPDLVGRIQGQEVVVFHCALSQVRGPRCARRLVEHISTLSNNSMDKVPQICILERGFNGWSDSGRPICRCPKASCRGC